MGVMACDRAECKNVMCDIYREEIGYICNDDFREAQEIIERDGKIDLIEFMKTPKKNSLREITSIEDLDKLLHRKDY